MTDKTADLAGPGISTYEEVAKILPRDYDALLTPKETMKALFWVLVSRHSAMHVAGLPQQGQVAP